MKNQPGIRRILRVELSTTTLLKTLGAVGLVWLLLQLWPILLVIAVALMLVGMLAPPIAWLEGKGQEAAAIATELAEARVQADLPAATTES